MSRNFLGRHKKTSRQSILVHRRSGQTFKISIFDRTVPLVSPQPHCSECRVISPVGFGLIVNIF